MNKDQNLPNKSIHRNNRSGKIFADNYNASRQQSPFRYNYHGRSQSQINSRNFSQNRYSRSNSQNNRYRNNYSRSNSNGNNYSNYNRNRLNSNPLNKYYSKDCSRNSSYNSY